MQRILIVEDDLSVMQLLSGWLRSENYSVETAESGEEALKKSSFRPELVISDLNMPEMDGIELMKRFKAQSDPPAFIIVTGLDEAGSGAYALEQGASAYVIKPFKKNEILIQTVQSLKMRELEKLRLNYENRLVEEIAEKTRQIRIREKQITQRLVMATEFNDPDTGSHIRRIGMLASQLALYAGLSQEEADAIELAASMHDIGKVGIPDFVLKKPGRYTYDEFEIMKSHCEIGAAILQGTDIPLMEKAVEIALNHHEKFDGTGYPNGLKGKEIPLSARITAIVDVFDAMLSNRVYRTAFNVKDVLEIISEQRGKHFDPELTDIFMENADRLLRLRESLLPVDKHVGSEENAFLIASKKFSFL